MPHTGANTRRKMLFATFVAAISIFVWSSKSWLRVWIAGKTLDELYKLLDRALWLVIVGVVIEEWSLIWKVFKFFRLAWAGKYTEARSKAWKHKGELVESVGFVVLTIGLAGELLLDPLIETRQTADQLRAEENIAALEKETKIAETKIAGARRDLATAQADAARANERASFLEAQAAASRAAAEQAKLNSEKLKLFVNWRTLAPDQVTKLIACLSLGGGKVV